MKNKLLTISIIITTLLSISAESQNNKSESNFIGEINPSIQIYHGNNSSSLIDFDQNSMILFAEEINMETRNREVVISLIDFKIKQFGKIGAAQKVFLPKDGLSSRDYKTYNVLDYQYKVIDLGQYLIFVDYEKMEMFSCKFGTEISSFFYNRTYYIPTKQIFTNEKGDFIIEYIKPSDKKVKIYQVFNKNGEEINVVKKNKNFIPLCSYFRGLNSQNYYQEVNPDCAFNNSIIHAYARVPKIERSNSTGKYYSKNPDENINSSYIEFFKNNNNRSIIYTYEFKFDKGMVQNAIVSLDLKYILINNKFIYTLPTVEISK